MKKKIFAEYTDNAHHYYLSDNWTLMKEINDIDDLFEFMKEIYFKWAGNKMSRNRSGLCYPPYERITFYTKKFITYNGENYFHEDKNPYDYPNDFFIDVVKRLKEFIELRVEEKEKMKENEDIKSRVLKEKAKLKELLKKYPEVINERAN